jgi:hypothetical protein
MVVTKKKKKKEQIFERALSMSFSVLCIRKAGTIRNLEVLVNFEY